MYWKIACEAVEDDGAVYREHADGRFVVHRHRDAFGPHLDLRVECGDCLMGWRIDAVSFEGEPWATEKGPHHPRWLEQHGDAECVETGLYRWLEQGPEERALLLMGDGEPRVIRVRPAEGLPPSVVRDVRQALAEGEVDPRDAARLVRDGITARTRAIERFRGLGRELDGAAFDDGVWRRTLGGLSLDEIHVHLRAYEVRFDEKYPPCAVSHPEPLPEVEARPNRDRAMAILRERAEV